MRETGNLQATFEELFDYLYANAPIRTPVAIWAEVEKILQTGVFIEQVRGIKPAFSFSRSDLARLTRFEDPVTSSVVSQVKNEFANMTEKLNRPSQDSPILLADQNIATTCRALSGVNLTSFDTDVVGDALEVFRHNWTKRNGGQFFTDSSVTQLAVELLGFDPRQGHDLVDLAAGTGGFLLAGASSVWNGIKKHSKDPSNLDTEFASLIKKSLKGVEIDQSLAQIANMTIGARLGDFDFHAVMIGDSLDPEFTADLSKFGIRDSSHMCAATNPPFGSKINVRNPSILSEFETAHIRKNGVLPSPTSLDILFLERNLKILKPGFGRLAIVLPYQITSGPQTRPVREWLLRHAALDAVIDLPPDTFQPHTGTKTCLVVLKRRREPLFDAHSANDEPIFMSVPKWIGHDRRGRPVYATASDGSPTNEILSDIDQVANAYKRFRLGEIPDTIHDESFIVGADQVFQDPQLRFNAKFFQPNEYLKAANVISRSRCWRTVKLGSLVERIFFPGRFKRRYVAESEDAVPFLGGANISQYVPVTEKWLSKNDPLIEKLQVFPEWLLITRSGSTGIVSLVPDHWRGWTVSEHVIRVVPNRELIHPSYLEAYLRTKIAKASIHRGVFGSVIDEITPEFLAEIEILIPESERIRDQITNEAILAKNARNNAVERINRAVEMIEEAVKETPY